MKCYKRILLAGANLGLGVLVLFATSALAATNSIRLAVGPFFAPAANESLQKSTELMPDLLTAKLSEQNHFQLVERQKASEVWRELNMTANGMNSAEAMLKLGRELVCDQFVTGSFVAAGTNVQIWITVIDTHSGVLTALQVFPFQDSKLDAILDEIALFLDQARTQKVRQKFLALGRFLDTSISSAHEDWSEQLRALIGKHFHEAGYAVVDNETVSPIFEEFQLEQAGFSESQTNRVKFQPAFWLIDGRCKWVRDTEDKLSVAVRVRKLGESEQVLQFSAQPGDEMASNICAAIEKDLTATNQISLELATREEVKLSAQEVTNAMTMRILVAPLRYSTNNEESNLMESRKQEALKVAQRAWLLDTNNLQAKAMVAFTYYHETNDPALQERGRQMLEELSTCTNEHLAYAAYNTLARGHRVMGRNGQMNTIIKPVKAIDPEMESKHQQQLQQLKQQSLKSAEARFAANTNDLDAKNWLAQAYFTDLGNATNRLRGMQMYEEFLTNDSAYYATHASNILANGVHLSDQNGGSILVMPIETPRFDFLTNQTMRVVPVQRPSFVKVDSFPGLSVRVLKQDDGWLIDKGSKLSFYNLAGEKFDVACPATRNITALAADKDFWWVGTDGEGLIRISRVGTSPKTFTQADGLLMPTISALCRNGDRLWIGFNFRGSGGLGYLDMKTEKFIGMQGSANFLTRGDAPVVSIQAADEKSVWVCSDDSLQQYDSMSGQMTRTIPAHFDLMSINANFLATSARSGMSPDDTEGVKIYDLKSNHWTKIELSKNEVENHPMALCADGQCLWVASDPQNLVPFEDTFISLIDIPSAKIIRRYAFRGVAVVYWIGTIGDEVWFLAGLDGQRIRLCRFSRSFSAMSQEIATNEKSAIEKRAELPQQSLSRDVPIQSQNKKSEVEERTEFLQQNFLKFMPIPFQKDANGDAVLQRLHVRQNMFVFNGTYFFGFRFTTPSWLDGDFEWMYLLAKTESEKNFSSRSKSYVIPQNGQLEGVEGYAHAEVANYPHLKQQFPYTGGIFIQDFGTYPLEPGKTYAVWFQIQEKNFPDIAIAMTVKSNRGTNEFGSLPLR